MSRLMVVNERVRMRDWSYAEVRTVALHVDENERGGFGGERTVVWPIVRCCRNTVGVHGGGSTHDISKRTRYLISSLRVRVLQLLPHPHRRAWNTFEAVGPDDNQTCSRSSESAHTVP